MTEQGDRIIGTPEAAQILGWHKRKVQRAANTGQIPVVGTLAARGEYLFDADVIEKIAHPDGSAPNGA
jgi:hypothetical protein